MKIGVIGAGYVGLTTGVCFSHLGHEVFIADKDPDRIGLLRQGKAPFFEPGLEDMLKKCLEKGGLHFTLDTSEIVAASEVIFICVGTPPRENGSADLSQIEQASRDIAENLNAYRIIVEKSTVPVKTSYWIERTIRLNLKKPVEFDVASNPEFLREGSAIHDFMQPDRIVIGVSSERARNILLKLYENFNCPIIVTDIASAELIKHASNSFLAMKIAYANLLADICEKTGADVKVVTKGMGLDERIGDKFLEAGIGYGGSCLPKDVKAFIRIGEELGISMDLLKAVDRINEERLLAFVDRVRQALWNISGKHVAVLGLAFKPGTDDVRESPGLKVAKLLLDEGAIVHLYDPQARENAEKILPPGENTLYFDELYKALEHVDAACITTAWEEIVNLDVDKARNVMRTPIFIDGRNIWECEQIIQKGVEYYPVGRPRGRTY